MENPGTRIKSEREALGWSQQKLADEISRIKKSKISRAAVAQWEAGSSKTQKPENLFPAAIALGLDVQWVMYGKGNKYMPPASIEAKAKMEDELYVIASDLHKREPSNQVNGLDAEEVQLLNNFQALDSKEDRSEVLFFVAAKADMSDLRRLQNLSAAQKNRK